MKRLLTMFAKTEVRDTRDAVRGKARGKRAAVRGAAAAATCLMLAGLLGCATATPSSKSQTANAAGLNGSTTNAEKAATAATGSACADGACAAPTSKEPWL